MNWIDWGAVSSRNQEEEIVDYLELGDNILVLLQLRKVHVACHVHGQLANPFEVGIHSDPLIGLLAHFIFVVLAPVSQPPLLGLLLALEHIAKTVEKNIVVFLRIVLLGPGGSIQILLSFAALQALVLCIVQNLDLGIDLLDLDQVLVR